MKGGALLRFLRQIRSPLRLAERFSKPVNKYFETRWPRLAAFFVSNCSSASPPNKTALLWCYRLLKRVVGQEIQIDPNVYFDYCLTIEMLNVIFRALDDGTRRAILDLLRRR